MTVVVGKLCPEKNKIDLVADSQITSGRTIIPLPNFSKLREVNGMIIGTTGSMDEFGMMLYYAKTHVPEDNDELDISRFMVEFLAFKKDKFNDAVIRNEYLIAFRGKLFTVSNTVAYPVETYYAIGSGRDFALAALSLGHSARESVEVATQLDIYVSGEIVEYTMNID